MSEKEILANFNEELRERVISARQHGISYVFLTNRTGFGGSTLKLWAARKFNLRTEKALKLDEVLEGVGF